MVTVVVDGHGCVSIHNEAKHWANALGECINPIISPSSYM